MLDQPTKPKSLEEIKAYLWERVIKQRNPMDGAEEDDVRRALDRLDSMDPDLWVKVWTDQSLPYVKLAKEQEATGRYKDAHDAYLHAYEYLRIARFPCPNTALKQEAANAAITNYLAASRYFDPPLEAISVPFSGKTGEGSRIQVYLRLPKRVSNPAVVIQHGGIDGFKEERHRYGNAFLEKGIATLAIDMPGTGESPVKGSLDSERVYDAILSYLATRSDVDGNRVALIGGSFGGYWAAKAAHVYPDRFAGVVDWGGGVHYGFQPGWIARSRYAGSYLTDLIETRAHAFGLDSYDEWIQFAPQLSLLDQRILDGPHAPMLLVNGREDAQTPIEDLYILLEHGGPKSARVFAGGHMGQTPLTYPTIVDWVAKKLGQPAKQA